MPFSFIGSNIIGSHGVGSAIHQPIGGAAGPLCDFSTYFNGANEVIENFVIKAPLRMDTDKLTADGQSNNLKVKSWTSTLNANIIFSEQAFPDRYYRHTSSVDSSTLLSLSFNTGTGEIRVILRDSGNVSFYSKILNTSALEVDQIVIDFDQSISQVTLTVDGVVEDTETVTITNNFAIDEYTIGYTRATNTDFSTMLLYDYELTGVGKTTFISNQSDGKFFVSDEGLAWTLEEDVLGSAQYPGTGYVWDVTTLFRQPKTDALSLNGDSLLGTFTSKDFSGDWQIVMHINIDNTASADDRLLYIDDSVGNGVINIDFNGSTAIRAIGTDNSSVSPLSLSVAYTAGTDAIVKLTRTGSSVTLDVNGVTDTDATVDFTTNGLDVNRINVAAEPTNVRELDCFLSSCSVSLIDDWRFIGRLPTQLEATGGTFIGLNNSIVLTLTDDATTGSYFPYLNAWPTAYVVSDTECTQPVGNQELVTNLGVGVTDKGLFVFNKVV